MRILNLYFSSTGNTSKVAERIDKTLKAAGHELDSVKITENTEVNPLEYDFVFAGSGVYAWLPGKPLQNLFEKLRGKYVREGHIKPSSPRLPDKKAVIYCTYGGVHTGINEAIPAVKYMGQLFDHLGIEVLDEWYFVGEYKPVKLEKMSINGRLGNIQGRPDEHDLKEVEEKVRGIIVRHRDQVYV